MELVSTQSRRPGVVISALRGGSGKTIFSVGIIAALRNRGAKVAPFKKGPDYIDAGWLSLAAGRPCYNLDTFLIQTDIIKNAYDLHTADTHVSVIEGNRGLYDCIDTDGETSTAELAKLLDLPLILCLDVTKTTRTMAAVVAGCTAFDPLVKIKGVVLNRVAGSRHENIVRNSIEQHCGIPVLGAVPKLRRQSFPERHMGLVPTYEHQWAHDAVDGIAELIEKYLDMGTVACLAGLDYRTEQPVFTQTTQTQTATLTPTIDNADQGDRIKASPVPRIGVIRDSAFQFYYPENLEALTMAGAQLVITSPLFEDSLPEVDALYIGGGFPETHAARLAKNVTYRRQIKTLAGQGLPIYAECGGLMYLGRELILEDGIYPMTGVLPVSFGFSKRPQGHGYTIVRISQSNPYFEVGQTIKGHEFHYSTVENFEAADQELAFEMTRGTGLFQGRDGFVKNNVLATYTHIHALGTPQWAPALVDQARRFCARR